MNSIPAFGSRQTRVLELSIGERVRVGQHLVTVTEIIGTEVTLIVERICGDDDGDDFRFEDLSELLVADYEAV